MFSDCIRPPFRKHSSSSSDQRTVRMTDVHLLMIIYESLSVNIEHEDCQHKKVRRGVRIRAMWAGMVFIGLVAIVTG